MTLIDAIQPTNHCAVIVATLTGWSRAFAFGWSVLRASA